MVVRSIHCDLINKDNELSPTVLKVFRLTNNFQL